MELATLLFLILIALVFFGMILFVAFGQITVRKLRKNEKTRDELGMEFVSGWDIINVAQALAMPRKWMRILKSTPLSGLFADADILRKHTTKFDRFLGSFLYWLLIVTFFYGVPVALLDTFGVFK